MKRNAPFAALALLAALVVIAPAGAKKDSISDDARPSGAKNDAVKGAISMQGLALSGTQFGTPTGNPTLVPTDALKIPLTEDARFRYSSIRRGAGPAGYNAVGLDFTPDYPGLSDPASLRFVVSGTVTKTKASGERGKIRGTITTYLARAARRRTRSPFPSRRSTGRALKRRSC